MGDAWICTWMFFLVHFIMRLSGTHEETKTKWVSINSESSRGQKELWMEIHVSKCTYSYRGEISPITSWNTVSIIFPEDSTSCPTKSQRYLSKCPPGDDITGRKSGQNRWRCLREDARPSFEKEAVKNRKWDLFISIYMTIPHPI